MSVVNIIDRVTDWAQKSICDKIKLKMPPEDELAPADVDYDHNLVTPAAFAMYVPTKDKLPPNVLSPIPSLCVRCREGEESLVSNKGTINMEMCFAAYNPGIYGADILKPVEGRILNHGNGEAPKQMIISNATAAVSVMRGILSISLCEKSSVQPPLMALRSNVLFLSSTGLCQNKRRSPISILIGSHGSVLR